MTHDQTLSSKPVQSSIMLGLRIEHHRSAFGIDIDRQFMIEKILN